MAGSLPARLKRNAASAMSPGLQALVLYTLVLGNQWVTERVWEWVSNHPDQALVTTAARVVNFPSWQLIPDERWGSPWRLWFILNLSTLVFLVTTADLLRWIGARQPSARRSKIFLSGLTVTVLAALLSQLLFNAAMGLLINGMFVDWTNDLGYAALAGLFFGVMVGLFHRWRANSTRRPSLQDE